MSAAQTIADAGSGDRISLTLFLAAAVHALLIFGIGFTIATSPAVQSNSVDVILVQHASKEPPEETELIAQANQHASGHTDQQQRPSDFVSGLSPVPTDGIAPSRTVNRQTSPSSAREAFVSRTAPSRHRVAAHDDTPNRDGQADKADAAEHQREMEIAQLTAELAQRQQRYAQRPRINYVDTLSAKTAVEAAYLKAWVNRVEQVGNLNYPDEARRSHLSGSLIVHVLLDHRGQLVKTKIGASSGQQVLDDAALRIVTLASPFKPFPAEMRKAYDQLMITRTWVFRSGDSLITR